MGVLLSIRVVSGHKDKQCTRNALVCINTTCHYGIL